MKKWFGAIILVPIIACIAAGALQERPRSTAPPPYVPPTATAPAPTRQQQPTFPMQRPLDEPATSSADVQKQLAIARNKEIKQDTDQLVRLARELRKTVNASLNRDALSLEAIKKTEDIEKLAKKLRNKMKDSYR